MFKNIRIYEILKKLNSNSITKKKNERKGIKNNKLKKQKKFKKK